MFKAIFLEFCRIYQFLLSRNSCLHLFCPGWDIPSPYLLSFPIACLSKKFDHMAPLLQRLDWFGCVCSDYKVTPMSAYRNGCLAIILLLALHKMSIPCLTLPLSSWPCSKISPRVINTLSAQSVSFNCLSGLPARSAYHMGYIHPSVSQMLCHNHI